GLARAWPQVPIAGVLQRLSLCYLAGAGLVQFPGTWVRAAMGVALLLGTWAALAWIPVPVYGAGICTHEGERARYLDRLYRPGKTMQNGWHSEGIMGTVPAIATCLIGTVVGQLFLRPKSHPSDNSMILAVFGLTAISVAWIWDYYLPINKKMWTPSYS